MESKEFNPGKLIFTDLCVRTLLFAVSLTSMVVMLTSNQTKLVMTPEYPVPVPAPAKYTYLPAFIYLVAATAVCSFYSLVTGAACSWVNVKHCSSKKLLKLYLIFIGLDVVMLGIVAAAAGTAGGVAYIGLEGNDYLNWDKICNVFGEFCVRAGASIALSVLASFILALLIFLSAYSVYRVAQNVIED